MKNSLLVVFVLSCSLLVRCDDPEEDADYYKGIDRRLRGEQLKLALHKLIAAHDAISYRDVWR